MKNSHRQYAAQRHTQQPARHGQIQAQPDTTLNIAPIQFFRPEIHIGEQPYKCHEEFQELCREHGNTHAFRRDGRGNKIVNIGLGSDIQPLGEVKEVPTRSHLLLLSVAIQRSLFSWLDGHRTIRRQKQPLMFHGSRDLLLSRAVKDCGQEPTENLEVAVRYALDARLLYPASKRPPYLGLVIDVDTANVIDIPVSSLIERGVDITGLYVCRRRPAGHEGISTSLETVGRVRAILGDELHLADNRGQDRVMATEVLLEPRQENLVHLLASFYPDHAEQIGRRLIQLRMNYLSGSAKLNRIRETLANLQHSKRRLRFSQGLEVQFQGLLDHRAPDFPATLKTERPTMLFGGHGRKHHEYPDAGIRKFGPYKFMFNERNDVTIAVVCEATSRGRVDQFVGMLQDGFPDTQWQRMQNGARRPKRNPYRTGLLAKYRLGRVRVEYEEVSDTSPRAYDEAIRRLLDRRTAPTLGLVQTRESFHKLANDENPYLTSKVAFMKAGIPSQAIELETIEDSATEVAYTLNNIALASYAKMGGTPWVISTRRPASHELVVGIGYTEVHESRLNGRQRYVGLTTVFQGNGRYLLWDQTREVEFEDYPSALQETLRQTIEEVRADINWQPGDLVRLVFHVYKPLKHKEIHAVRELVRGLVGERFQVEYAFLDISSHHEFRLFSPSQSGRSYRTPSGHWRKKGMGVCQRGECLQLDRHRALLQLAGASDVKTEEQGCPRPLLVTLHKKSDFTDLTYLVRQIYHFSYMSWRSFFPGTVPVTIAYARKIAHMLGQLRTIPGWDSQALRSPSLRGSKWFL